MNIKPVRTDQDYQEALQRVEALMGAAPNSPEEDELDVLATLVESYEAKHVEIELPNPIAAIEFRMDQLGLKRKDLEPMIGPKGRVSEILSGERGLSLSMIRKLHRELDIPLETLIAA